MYGSSLKLVGQAQDFRVQYDSIVRIFMLPKPNSAVTLVAISLDPPIRRGQTYYPHILCQFPADEETSIELDITEEALAARNQRSKAAGGRGDLVKKLTGSTAEVFAKVLRGLSGSRLSKPGSFKDAEGTGQAIRCSYKADDGYVFPLERAFFYIQKPPLLLTYDEVDSVEFMRQATGITAARTFDLQVRMKTGTDHIFRGIPRSEWTNLFEFIQAKSLRVENFREAKAGPGATRPHYAMGDEGGPDAGLAKLEAQGGMSDGSDEDEDEEEEDEDFAASSDDSSSSSDSDSEGDAIVVDEDDVKVGKGSGEKKKKKKRPATEDADSGSDQEGAAAGGGGSAKKKQRKKKDPNAPKKGMSAFMLFSNAIRATVKAESPELSFGDIAKAISEKWKVLDPAEKGKYEAQAAADKERYEREKKEYVTKQAGGGGGGGGEEEEMQVKDDDKEVKEEEEKEEGEKEAAAPEIIKQEEKLAEVKAEEPGAEVK
jgi:structure-specific recognition protein 1